MMIEDLGAGVVSVWERLRPMTRQMLVGQMEAGSANNPTANPTQKFSYDAHADWELSRLLYALDEQSRNGVRKDPRVMGEISQLAETCARVLESQSASAEVFIQLADRAIARHDYKKLDRLSDRLLERYSAGEIAEIIRQTEIPQIRAIAYETLVLLPVPAIAPLLDDPLYSSIAANALEQKAIEYDSDEAKDVLDQFDQSFDARVE